MVPLCFHLNISLGVRNVHYWDYNTNRSTPVGAWCWWSPSLSQLITFEKPKRIFVTKGSCWCVPWTSILRIRHQRIFFCLEDYIPLNLFTYIMNIYVICIVYMNFPKSFKCNLHTIYYIYLFVSLWPIPRERIETSVAKHKSIILHITII